MRERPTVIVSDAHLGAVPEENERAFLSFLESVPSLGDDLLINGDLFDFWFEYRTVILRRHFGVLRRLADLIDSGLRIRLVGGNHDAWGGDFLQDEIGIELIEGSATLVLGGRRTFVAHGDGLAGGDWGYRMMKRATRSSPGAAAFRLLHPDAAAHLIGRVSGTSDRHAAGPADEKERADRLSDYAAKLLKEDPSFDLIVFGHSHRPELREVEPGRFYLNAGDWIHHMSYALVGTHKLELCEWHTPDSGP
jgi:UDP-2,3-diacylglucosamine hydrolase